MRLRVILVVVIWFICSNFQAIRATANDHGEGELAGGEAKRLKRPRSEGVDIEDDENPIVILDNGCRAPSRNMAKSERHIHKRVKRAWWAGEVKPHSRPWMISLTDENDETYCGAALLRVGENMNESDIGITAAQCARKNAIAVLGAHGLYDKGEARVAVTGFYPYQHLVPALWPVSAHEATEDIAIFQLNTSVKLTDKVDTINLPDPDQVVAKPGDVGYVSGWGEQAGGGPKPEKLQEVDLLIVEPLCCVRQKYPQFTKENMLCVTSVRPWALARNFCKGDTGGAFFEKLGSEYVLTGIASDSTRCGSKTPTTAVRVSHYLAWIKQSIRERSSLI